MRVIKSETHAKRGCINLNAEFVTHEALVDPVDLSRSRNGPALTRLQTPRSALGLAWPGLALGVPPVPRTPSRPALPRVGSVQQGHPCGPRTTLSDGPSQSCKWQVAALGARGAWHGATFRVRPTPGRAIRGRQPPASHLWCLPLQC